MHNLDHPYAKASNKCFSDKLIPAVFIEFARRCDTHQPPIAARERSIQGC